MYSFNIFINSWLTQPFIRFVYFVMDTITQSTKSLENEIISIGESTSNSTTNNNENSRAQTILIIQSTTASVGIVANLTVIVVFLNHTKLRRKIPNIFIINQVRTLITTFVR